MTRVKCVLTASPCLDRSNSCDYAKIRWGLESKLISKSPQIKGQMPLPLVAIVGRPNVGKSTLFNRLVGERRAITESISGVTRDRIYARADWAGRDFLVIDTGGIVPDSQDIFERQIRRQAEIAISEAAVILFVVDVTAGVHPLDMEVGEILRRSGKPV